MVVGENGFQIQAGQQVKLGRFRDGRAQRVRLVVPLMVIIEGILGVAAIAGRPLLPRFVIGRPVQAPEKVARLHEEVGSGVAGIVVSAAGSTAHRYIGSQFKELSDALIYIHPAGVAVKSVHAQTALVVGIGKGSIIGRSVLAAAHAQVIGLIHGGAEIGVIPVKITALAAGMVIFRYRHRSIGPRFRGTERVSVFVEFAVQPVQGGHIGIRLGLALAGNGIIMEHGVEHIHLFLYARSLVVPRCPGRGNAHRHVQPDRGTAFLTCLGGNQDHAVRRTGTIQRRSRRILQDRDGLDIVRIQVVQQVIGRIGIIAHLTAVAAVYRYPVNYIEGFVRGVHGADAPDTHLRHASGLAGRGGYLQAGHTAAQGALETGCREALKDFRSDHGCTSGIAAFLGSSIGYDKDFIQRQGIG